MDLHVTFTGLCLFVRDPTSSNMHVLMPGTGAGGGGGHVGKHHVALDYPGGIPLDMEGWTLDLSGLGSTGGGMLPPSQIIDVGRLAGKGVHKEQFGLDPDPPNSVAARITLPPVKHFEPGETATWTVEPEDGTAGGEVTLTHDVTCVVEGINHAAFRWERKKLVSGDVDELLRPRPMGNVVTLLVRHLPHVPEVLTPNAESKHFQAYLKVFRGKVKHAKLKLKLPPPSGRGAAAPIFGGSPFNCMLAQSDPG
jgi:hypothetical protein